MNTYIQSGGFGKANSVVVKEDGCRDVINWRLGNHNVPAVHRVRATVVRQPFMHYVHANYGPEVMAIRSESIARLGWSSQSFDMPLVPHVVGNFNLLSQAVAVVQKELKGGPTKACTCYPNMISLRQTLDGYDEFRIYLNIPAYEFYHLLFIVGSRAVSSQFVAKSVSIGTCPKLLSWLRPFETAKKKLYCDNGFDWNPRRGMIDAGLEY